MNDRRKYTGDDWIVGNGSFIIATSKGCHDSIIGHAILPTANGIRFPYHKERAANLRLMASGPKLLEALQTMTPLARELLEYLSPGGRYERIVHDLCAARAVISEALGEEVADGG